MVKSSVKSSKKSSKTRKSGSVAKSQKSIQALSERNVAKHRAAMKKKPSRADPPRGGSSSQRSNKSYHNMAKKKESKCSACKKTIKKGSRLWGHERVHYACGRGKKNLAYAFTVHAEVFSFFSMFNLSLGSFFVAEIKYLDY